MKLLFTRRRAIGSWIIRLVTWSVYSHVDIVLDDDTLIGAIAGEGVVKTPRWSRLEMASDAVEITVPVPLQSSMLAFALGQVGKSYDWLGILGIGLKQDWQHDKKWSCAELVYAAMVRGGLAPYDLKYHHRITPQHLLMLNFKKTKIK